MLGNLLLLQWEVGVVPSANLYVARWNRDGHIWSGVTFPMLHGGVLVLIDRGIEWALLGFNGVAKCLV